MIKIYTEQERKEMGEVRSIDLEEKYKNTGFVLLNSRYDYEDIDGHRCNCGTIGTLYAMADYEDFEAYKRAISEASDIKDCGCVAVFDTFDLEDGYHVYRRYSRRS